MVTAQDAVFPLYDDKLAADAAGYTRRIELLAYFPGTVDGLAKGAPVTLRGIRIGQVTSVRLEYDRQSDTLRVPVRFEVQPQRVADSDEVAPRGPLDNIRRLVAQGLRAQLNTVSLLTGQKGIELAMVADAPPAEVTIVDGDIIMPTAPDQFGSIVESVNALVAKLSKLPFERIGANLDATLAGVNDMVNGAPLRQTLVALQGTMNAAREVMTALAGSSGPAIRRLPQIAADLQDSMTRANRLLLSLDTGYGDNSKFNRDLNRLMVQLNDAAQAIRVLSDVLTRHPEALIRGRPDLGGGK
jgi:paraquat-inducible protein B